MTKFQEVLHECLSQVQDDSIEAMIACWSRPRLHFVAQSRLVFKIQGIKAQTRAVSFAECRVNRPARLGARICSALGAGKAG